jgi:hypothetical protein
MASVHYETEGGVFEFDLEDVIKKLAYYSKEKHIEEAIELIDILSPPVNEKITIPEDFRFIEYVIFDLLMDEKGSVKCKTCDISYVSSDLKFTRFGHGKIPSEINIPREQKEALKAFQKNRELPGMFGEKGYNCPKNHELITMITWKT